MGAHMSESTEDNWFTRTVHDLQVALAEEEAHWSRLVKGQPAAEQLPVFDAAYVDAVEHVDRAQYEMFEAMQARNRTS
jgi:hypothetical protein